MLLKTVIPFSLLVLIELLLQSSLLLVMPIREVLHFVLLELIISLILKNDQNILL